MHRLADEIREAFSERGHKIETAVQSDPAFHRTRHVQSHMVRGLVLTTIEEWASRLGLGCISVTGGAIDVQQFVGLRDRRYRVRKADIDPETGQYEILCGSDAIFTITDADPDAMTTFERWVLAYTVDELGMIGDIFAALVEGQTEDSVPRLLLGPITPLGSAFTPIDPNTGFEPDDEEDLGAAFDDDQDETGEDATGAAM